MSTWRPHPHIRVVAIGLHWRGGRLLAAEVRDDAGRIKGVRPLGGEIEFGESWRTALVREFNEELGIDITIIGEPLVMENIFVHEGSTGHEVMFIAEVALPDGAFSGQDRIDFREDYGEEIVARWFDLADLDVEGGPSLYPNGLKDVLLRSKVSAPSP
ncbi:DNA mismatch repair protein MutT [Bradyrhizobium japonicum]|uniref:DNA mismatch repair protein MutT n=1 Tax=Bradyrhizobium japonicum TaxID=375 RepID=A0A0A3Y2V3_BRAJP|nr:NUDIX hydrolase [Bradyrhizobium japonicum]KGT81017.1 DNA mismatch repair protein MutT [Bradyrhizobium japonicum]MCS3892638.1 8-oxo-dGTP pyrophosphatase MutT (NUDIX family) [Bradyrhizobium japonicum USDA 38]MCS3945151.1 8-oxo-dGTP pyrophosphatase MutT (NUDIX family) [Bradyrhizobium japonicum]MCW2222322.1 8-oxo-dGTP pyrophosphatase MutT (NUDIX family) [Bradyrhizobium japonicum]MCW2346934.1 8-oxo-dGTP pyrophosphatase MutT (NUDIX family) [Bradyrhizobium japonicum]